MSHPTGPAGPAPGGPTGPGRDLTALSEAEAQRLEAAFLAGLNDAQDAYERIVRASAWTVLGFGTFAEWWEARVRPIMRALSMRPTREIATAVVDQVRQEEAELPPAQRRTQQELAEMVGIDRSRLANRDGSRSLPREDSRRVDLESPTPTARPAADPGDPFGRTLDEYAPDPDAPHREWRRNFLAAINGAYRPISRSTTQEVAERADDECVAELVRVAAELTLFAERVRQARVANRPNNVISLVRPA